MLVGIIILRWRRVRQVCDQRFGIATSIQKKAHLAAVRWHLALSVRVG
jgi:hypothetical protein